MPKLSSDLIGNIGRVYANYGGFNNLIRSEYFYLSLAITAACWRKASDPNWPSMAWSILPNLTGFSIAAYALLFSVLDSEQRRALRQPSEHLNGRAPLLVLASSITHAIVIQITAILFAVIFDSRPLPHNYDFPYLNTGTNYAFSAFGIFLFTYAVILILASVLSIFRLLILAPPANSRSRTQPHPPRHGED